MIVFGDLFFLLRLYLLVIDGHSLLLLLIYTCIHQTSSTFMHSAFLIQNTKIYYDQFLKTKTDFSSICIKLDAVICTQSRLEPNTLVNLVLPTLHQRIAKEQKLKNAK